MANAEMNRIDDFDLDEYGFRSVRFACRSIISQIFYSDLAVLLLDYWMQCLEIYLSNAKLLCMYVEPLG